ncbi:homoserine kinase [Candidatus Bathyarchaeota archaeon A05DMB-2]|jgi:homoserine kinase|nr:homoserine kinase [Candidatus Bathyarchaeota archaeon A05DMB-2]
MPHNQVTVKAPATTANLGPGYDVFGLALAEPSDKVTLTRIPSGVRIEVAGISAAAIPTAPEKNTAGVVAAHILKEFSLKTGVHVKIMKGILPGIGLGSSAASAAAVAYGLNHMFSLNLNSTQVVRLAAKGEVASAGFEHADNVAAAICGDFVIIKSYNPLEIVNLKAPVDMEVCVAYHNVKTLRNKTEKARSVVPKQVPIEKLVHNVGKAAALAAGFATGNVDLIGEAMQDAVVEPARAFLIPGYERVKENALKAGACGVTISGAGPAMLSIVNKKKADAAKVASAMKAGFECAGVEATAFATKPGKGACIMEME